MTTNSINSINTVNSSSSISNNSFKSSKYTFTNLLNLIQTAIKYKKSKKRPRKKDLTESIEKFVYSLDMENLCLSIEPLTKLNNLIGMESLKESILDQVLFYVQELNTNEMLHTCITGPPGVGKTTLGKILAELYCSLGFLKSPDFKVVTRSDLIAGYLGQTAIKTKKVLNEAKGSVLFIDEAYSLGRGEDESGSSYSKECIDTINQFLSENTTDFVMIIAGYKEELDKCFFAQNKGLDRRFPWRYEIKEYDHKNLKDIFKYQVLENNWKLDKYLSDDKNLDSFFEKYKKEPNGLFENNGGDTLLLFDKAKIIHSRRMFGEDFHLKKKLSIDDLTQAINLMIKFKNLKTNHKYKNPPEGMYI